MIAVAAIAGFSAGGCSFSYQLGSMFDKDDAPKPEVTGSVPPVPEKQSGRFPDADLALASAAAADVLSAGEKDASAPWANPRTGARGTVTPIATSYTVDGFLCRDFLASYVNDDGESWLHGEACQVHHGKWVVKSLKPWKRV